MIGLNVGSGQRRFHDPSGQMAWINVDLSSKHPPDVRADGACLPFRSLSMEVVVLHHVLEHFGLGEADGMLRECHRVLKSGGRLLVFVPDLKKLAQRWLLGELEDYLYLVNLYGAYQGEEADRHKWGFTTSNLWATLDRAGTWAYGNSIRHFDWRPIPGLEAARDWWILGAEAVK